MSFGKAKIQRFNDIKPCAPGPTAYNVAVKDKPKGAVLPQVERFIEIKSPSISEAGSTHSTPCLFRTPTLLKRKKTTTSVTKSKPKELILEASDVEILKEKIVECQNKDAFIKDLHEQIEEFKEKIGDLEKQRNQLRLSKVEIEKQIANLNIEHEDRLKEMTEKFKDDINKTAEEKKRLNEELVLIRKEHKVLKETSRIEMEELMKSCDKFKILYSKSIEECNELTKEKDILLKDKEEELRTLEERCVEMQRKHSLDIEKLQKEHQIEVQEIEFEMLKTMTELERERECAAKRIVEMEEMIGMEIKKLQRSFEEEKEQLVLQSETRIKQIKENLKAENLFTDAQLQEELNKVENIWKTKLQDQEKQAEAILKECQAISEYNIIQCELEKNEIRTNLTEKTEELEAVQLKHDEIARNYDELDTNFKNLQCELSKVIIELNDVRKSLGEKLEHKNKELKKLAEEKRAYKVTIKNSQVTIDVLTKRLIHSDRDVEQLKKELTDTEAKILEYESRCMQLTNDIKQSQTFSDELEMQYESAIKLNTSEIQQLKTELVQKVDTYKAEALSTIRKLREEKEMTKEIMQQLHEAYAVIDKVKLKLKNLEILNSQYELESEQTQNELRYYKNKVTEYEKELSEADWIHKRYIEQSGKYDELLQKLEQLELENVKNKKKCSQQSKDLDLKEKYNKQKEAYDKLLRKYEQLEKENCSNKGKIQEQGHLRERLDQVEAERDMLLDRVNCLDNELKEVSEKYIQLTGYQNSHKEVQRLQDLEPKNEALIQSKQELEMKLQKFKKENADLKKCLRKTKMHGGDKENIGSPNRSLNSSRIESPLKDRN